MYLHVPHMSSFPKKRRIFFTSRFIHCVSSSTQTLVLPNQELWKYEATFPLLHHPFILASLALFQLIPDSDNKFNATDTQSRYQQLPSHHMSNKTPQPAMPSCPACSTCRISWFHFMWEESREKSPPQPDLHSSPRDFPQLHQPTQEDSVVWAGCFHFWPEEDLRPNVSGFSHRPYLLPSHFPSWAPSCSTALLPG